MPPETRIFLLITPPQRPFSPIEASCTVVGNADKIFGTRAEFGTAKELETRLMKAGLPECEIERAILRLETAYPTFNEISHAVAESLGLIQPSADLSNSIQPERFKIARRVPLSCRMNGDLAIVFV